MKTLLLQPCPWRGFSHIPCTSRLAGGAEVLLTNHSYFQTLILHLLYKSPRLQQLLPLCCCNPLTRNFPLFTEKLVPISKSLSTPNFCHHSWQLQHPGGGHIQHPGLSVSWPLQETPPHPASSMVTPWTSITTKSCPAYTVLNASTHFPSQTFYAF